MVSVHFLLVSSGFQHFPAGFHCISTVLLLVSTLYCLISVCFSSFQLVSVVSYWFPVASSWFPTDFGWFPLFFIEARLWYARLSARDYAILCYIQLSITNFLGFRHIKINFFRRNHWKPPETTGYHG